MEYLSERELDELREEVRHNLEVGPGLVIYQQVARLLAERDALRAEVECLVGWLEAIDGGDNPCTDESKLRQMAYNALTLHKAAPTGEVF